MNFSEFVKSLKTTQPNKPGLYMRLYSPHSREISVLQEVYIGPLQSFSCSNLEFIFISTDSNPEVAIGSSLNDILRFHDDIISFEGIYYDSWSFEVRT